MNTYITVKYGAMEKFPTPPLSLRPPLSDVTKLVEIESLKTRQKLL